MSKNIFRQNFLRALAITFPMMFVFSISNADIGNPERILNTTASTSAKTKRIQADLKSTDKPADKENSSLWNWMKPRLLVGAYMVMANTLTGDFSSSTAAGSAEMTTNSGLGFQAQLIEFQKWNKWGPYGSFGFEAEKDIRSIQLKSPSLSGTGQIDTRLKTFVLGGGVNYSVGEHVYVPMGLNLPMFIQTSKGQLDLFRLSPRIGMQFGAGVKVKENMFAEILWRRLSFDGDAGNNGDNVHLSNLKLEGLNLQASYKF